MDTSATCTNVQALMTVSLSIATHTNLLKSAQDQLVITLFSDQFAIQKHVVLTLIASVDSVINLENALTTQALNATMQSMDMLANSNLAHLMMTATLIIATLTKLLMCVLLQHAIMEILENIVTNSLAQETMIVSLGSVTSSINVRITHCTLAMILWLDIIV